nr:acetyl-CoA C-acyltransferase [Bacillus subtilis]
MGAICVKETLKRAGGYEGNIDDLIIGCATPEAEQGLNMARNIGALAACRTRFRRLQLTVIALQAFSLLHMQAEKIMLGAYDTAIAGGAESMSQVPMMGHVTRPNLALAENAPEYYMSMGHTAEQVAKKYGVSREDQDAFAVRDHQNAAKALAEGKFKDEIVPVEVTVTEIGEDHKPMEKQFVFSQDEGVRPQTTADILSTLRPAFSVDGTVTAGNSSQTSDGAAAVMLMDREKADALYLAPLVKFRSFAVGGVPPEVMGIGPVEAIPRALKLAGLQPQDIGLFELNEAFASHIPFK